MKALGLDPGISNPGASIVLIDAERKFRLLECPTLRDADELYWWMNDVDSYFIDVVAIESVAWSVHRARNGHGSARILETVGAARALAQQQQAMVDIIEPRTWKKLACGSGKANKEQCREVLRRRVEGVPAILNTNRSDAIGIAVAGLMRARAKGVKAC